jgi:hypothetical protein
LIGRWTIAPRRQIRSNNGIAEVQAAIEYEYEYEYRFAEYEYDEFDCYRYPGSMELKTQAATWSR